MDFVRATAGRDAVGYRALWGLAVLLVVMYAASLLGPPPQSETAIAWAAQAQGLLAASGC